MLLTDVADAPERTTPLQPRTVRRRILALVMNRWSGCRAAVAAERASGEPVLLGDVDPDAGEAWHMLCACGRIRSHELARRLGLEPESCDLLLSELYRRRLVRRCGDSFESLSFTASAADESHAPDELRGIDRPEPLDG